MRRVRCKGPIGYNGMPKIQPPKLPLPFDDHHPHPIPISRPTPLTTSNGIWIHSAVLPQYTFQTDRQTDTDTHRWARRQVCNTSASLAKLIYSDVLIIIKSLYSRHNLTPKNRKRFVLHFPVLHFPVLHFPVLHFQSPFPRFSTYVIMIHQRYRHTARQTDG